MDVCKGEMIIYDAEISTILALYYTNELKGPMNDARVWIRKYANTPYWTLVLSDSRLFVVRLDYVCRERALHGRI